MMTLIISIIPTGYMIALEVSDTKNSESFISKSKSAPNALLIFN